MDAWLLVSVMWLRAGLALSFLLAAVSKRRDRGAFTSALRALGIERSVWVERLVAGVPLGEAALGLWLWTGWQPFWSAAMAGAALVALTSVLLALRHRGYTGACGCFVGEGSTVGPLAYVRNAVLLAMAICVGAGAYLVPSPVGAPWEHLRLATLFAGVAAFGGYVWLMREDAVVESSQPITLATGTATATAAAVMSAVATTATDASSRQVAVGLELTDLTGARVRLGRPDADAQLVVFARGKCPGCRRDRDILNGLSLESARFEVVIVCGGDLEETTTFAALVRSPVRVVWDPRWQAAVAWQVTTTPFSVLVDRHGQVHARGPLAPVLALLTAPGLPSSPCAAPVGATS